MEDQKVKVLGVCTREEWSNSYQTEIDFILHSFKEGAVSLELRMLSTVQESFVGKGMEALLYGTLSSESEGQFMALRHRPGPTAHRSNTLARNWSQVLLHG